MAVIIAGHSPLPRVERCSKQIGPVMRRATEPALGGGLEHPPTHSPCLPHTLALCLPGRCPTPIPAHLLAKGGGRFYLSSIWECRFCTYLLPLEKKRRWGKSRMVAECWAVLATARLLLALSLMLVQGVLACILLQACWRGGGIWCRWTAGCIPLQHLIALGHPALQGQ